MKPLPSTFLCIVVFGGLLRLIELGFFTMLTSDFLVSSFKEIRFGPFSLSKGVLIVCSLFLLLATVELAADHKRGVNWASFMISLILFVYGYGIFHFTN